MVFENGVRNIQAAAYNGARSVSIMYLSEINVFQLKNKRKRKNLMSQLNNIVDKCPQTEFENKSLDSVHIS